MRTLVAIISCMIGIVLLGPTESTLRAAKANGASSYFRGVSRSVHPGFLVGPVALNTQVQISLLLQGRHQDQIAGILLEPTGHYGYVVNSGSHSVTVFDTQTGTVVSTIFGILLNPQQNGPFIFAVP